jgi:chaperonin GroES
MADLPRTMMKISKPVIPTALFPARPAPANLFSIKPVGDRILIRHIEEKEQVRGGVIIPDSAKEKPQQAEIIALGTGYKDKDGQLTAFEVKVGDRVLLAKYGGAEVKVNEQKYTIVREDDILGIID